MTDQHPFEETPPGRYENSSISSPPETLQTRTIQSAIRLIESEVGRLRLNDTSSLLADPVVAQGLSIVASIIGEADYVARSPRVAPLHSRRRKAVPAGSDLWLYRESAARAVGLAALCLLSGMGDRLSIDSIIKIACGLDEPFISIRRKLLNSPIDFLPDRLYDLAQIPGVRDYEALQSMGCIGAIQAALARMAAILPSMTTARLWTEGVISRILPPTGCVGDVITIEGMGFHELQPQGVQLRFPLRRADGGCFEVQPIEWTESSIRVVLPEAVGCGCVGFVWVPESFLSAISGIAQLVSSLDSCFGAAAAGTIAMLEGMAGGMSIPCPSGAPADPSWFCGGVPIIDEFTANLQTELTIGQHEVISLAWSVLNAREISCTATSPSLPSVELPQLAVGSVDVSARDYTDAWDGMYILAAKNDCGQVTRVVTVHYYPRKALVLSGGGTKCAFEVGAVACLFREFNYSPQIISATSGGALNAAKLAEGEGALEELVTLWQSLTWAADMYDRQQWLLTLEPLLQHYVLSETTSLVEMVGMKLATSLLQTMIEGAGGPGWVVSFMSMIPSLVRYGIDTVNVLDVYEKLRDAQAVLSLQPLRTHMLSHIDVGKIRHWEQQVGGRKLIISAVALETGQVAYFDAHTDYDLRDIALASASIPIAFPPVKLGAYHYVDGGVRVNVPIRAAIEAGADQIVVIMASPVGLSASQSPRRYSLPEIATRTLEILLDECEQQNIAPYRGYDKPITIIAPDVLLYTALDVDPGLISINMDYGYMRAYDELQTNANIRRSLRSLSTRITELR